MDAVVADLAAFYEEEAASGRRIEPSGRRIDARQRFVELLVGEEGRSVLELGCGPGHERPAFAAAGIEFVGIDLAVGNALLATKFGAMVIPASLFALPFRSGSFDACWSMSTLMHVPLAGFDDAMEAVLDPLRVGAPLGIGLWGSSSDADREFVSQYDGNGTQRLFSLRTADHNHELFARHVTVEQFETWDVGPDGWEYHFGIFRWTA